MTEVNYLDNRFLDRSEKIEIHMGKRPKTNVLDLLNPSSLCSAQSLPHPRLILTSSSSSVTITIFFHKLFEHLGKQVTHLITCKVPGWRRCWELRSLHPVQDELHSWKGFTEMPGGTQWEWQWHNSLACSQATWSKVSKFSQPCSESYTKPRSSHLTKSHEAKKW